MFWPFATNSSYRNETEFSIDLAWGSLSIGSYREGPTGFGFKCFETRGQPPWTALF